MKIRRIERAVKVSVALGVFSLWCLIQSAAPGYLVAAGLLGLAAVQAYRAVLNFRLGLTLGGFGEPRKLSSGGASADSMTPEKIIANGWGPLDVALILVSQGWTIERSHDPCQLDVVAVQYEDVRDLWSPQTTTRRREAKHLSEALGGRYSFTTEAGPSEWPADWDFECHDLIAWLEASECS